MSVDVDPNWLSETYPGIGRIQSLTPAPVAGFSGACVWRVTSERSDFALRATPDDHVDPHRLEGLHRLLSHLRASGITQISLPLRNWKGRTWHRSFGSVWQLESWQPGRADFHDNPSPQRLDAIMLLLARWHNAAASFVATTDEAPWFFVIGGSSPAVRERRHKIEMCTPAYRARLREELRSRRDSDSIGSLGLQILDAFERDAISVSRDLDAAREIHVPLQPCLRDVWHDHVFFEGDQVTGLIDPHAARSDSVATDLSRLLRSLVGSDRIAWDRGLQAYQRLRPLTLAELGLIEVLDHSGLLLSPMTWLNWICVEKRPFPDQERVIQRLRKLLAQLAQTHK